MLYYIIICNKKQQRIQANRISKQNLTKAYYLYYIKEFFLNHKNYCQTLSLLISRMFTISGEGGLLGLLAEVASRIFYSETNDEEKHSRLKVRCKMKQCNFPNDVSIKLTK